MQNKIGKKELEKLAGENQKHAFKIIQDLQITETWESFGAKVNLIGSLATGLLLKHKDIDFHIYSEKPSITPSFKAMAKLAENPKIKRITYDNLLDTPEMCLEWHAWYEDDNLELWQIDMIHLLKESPYAGKMEKVTERLNSVLTPEQRYTILSIKYDMPENEKITGIEIYQAVIRDGVRDYQEMLEWKSNQNGPAIIDWIP